MHRFFVPPEWLQQEPIVLTGPLAHQLGRVLRTKPGEHIMVLDNTGWAYESEVTRVTSDQILARMVDKMQPHTEPATRLTLYQALTREKKFDWALQKGVELGVSAFAPLLTERGLLNRAEQVRELKNERWGRIVIEAAEQSGRARLPELWPVQTVAEACAALPPCATALIACPGESLTLRDLEHAWRQSPPREVRLFIGPEGGFTDAEVTLARRAGVTPISLGPRTLRTETAGLAATAIVFYILDNL